MTREAPHIRTRESDTEILPVFVPIVITDAMRAALWEHESRNWRAWHDGILQQLEGGR